MGFQASRRNLLKLAGSSAATAGFLGLSGCSSVTQTFTQPVATGDFDRNDDARRIRQRIRAPEFPPLHVSITEYGAKPAGESSSQADATQAIRDAISDVAAQGGGTVEVPAGEFYTGPVHLKSNINFYLAKGAVLHFIPEPELYKPYVFTRWEGTELMGYSPLIYAFEETNVAITGEGTLEGGGSPENWWPWKGKWKEAKWGDDPVANQKYTRDVLRQMAEDGVPVADRVFEENYLRPPFIQPYRCKNVLISGVLSVTPPSGWSTRYCVPTSLCGIFTVTAMALILTAAIRKAVPMYLSRTVRLIQGMTVLPLNQAGMPMAAVWLSLVKISSLTTAP